MIVAVGEAPEELRLGAAWGRGQRHGAPLDDTRPLKGTSRELRCKHRTEEGDYRDDLGIDKQHTISTPH